VALACLLVVVFAIALTKCKLFPRSYNGSYRPGRAPTSVEEVKVMPKVKAQPKPGFEYTEILKQADVTPAYVKEYESVGLKLL